ncbi:MAG: hypothetical protein OZ919_01910 [Xanthomonadaceae bacterium]|nr:hypothetical protein [Xanthomonadaceae bacterium]
MTLPKYLDIREMARAAGDHSAIERLIDQQHAEREELLRLHAVRAENEMFRVLGGRDAIQGIIDRERTDWERAFDSYRQLASSSVFDLQASPALHSMTQAVEAARRAGAFELPNLIDQYRVSDVSLAALWADARRLSWWDDSFAETLNAHSALSAMFDRANVFGHEAWSAIDSVLSDPFFGLHTVRQARELLDISGLLRAPRFRILTRKEKRKTIRLLIRDNAMPPEVRKAQGLVHRYEKALRTLIGQCMEGAYGEDWTKERLPLCGCRKLLGRSLDGDESVLDHADYKHYELIMCHHEHFEAVFAIAYEDVDRLRLTIVRLGQLRARSHHGRTFTAEDLQELITLWRAMEAGFEGLIDDVAVEP